MKSGCWIAGYFAATGKVAVGHINNCPLIDSFLVKPLVSLIFPSEEWLVYWENIITIIFELDKLLQSPVNVPRQNNDHILIYLGYCLSSKTDY